jgi:hypothetical protein
VIVIDFGLRCNDVHDVVPASMLMKTAMGITA